MPSGENADAPLLFDYRICNVLLPIQFCKKTDDVYQICCVVFIDDRLFCPVHKPASSADGGIRARPALVSEAVASANQGIRARSALVSEAASSADGGIRARPALVPRAATSANQGIRTGSALVPEAATSADPAKNVNLGQPPELRPVPAVIGIAKCTKKPARKGRLKCVSLRRRCIVIT